MRIPRRPQFAGLLSLSLLCPSCFTSGVWGSRPSLLRLPDPEHVRHDFAVDAAAIHRDPEARPVQMALRVPTLDRDRSWLLLEPEWQTTAMAECLLRLRRGGKPYGPVGVTVLFDAPPSGAEMHGSLILPRGCPSPQTRGADLAHPAFVPCRLRFLSDPPPGAEEWPEAWITVRWVDDSHPGTTALRVVLTPFAVVADIVTLPIVLILWVGMSLDPPAGHT
jgi:hypothetical protein